MTRIRLWLGRFGRGVRRGALATAAWTRHRRTRRTFRERVAWSALFMVLSGAASGAGAIYIPAVALDEAASALDLELTKAQLFLVVAYLPPVFASVGALFGLAVSFLIPIPWSISFRRKMTLAKRRRKRVAKVRQWRRRNARMRSQRELLIVFDRRENVQIAYPLLVPRYVLAAQAKKRGVTGRHEPTAANAALIWRGAMTIALMLVAWAVAPAVSSLFGFFIPNFQLMVSISGATLGFGIALIVPAPWSAPIWWAAVQDESGLRVIDPREIITPTTETPESFYVTGTSRTIGRIIEELTPKSKMNAVLQLGSMVMIGLGLLVFIYLLSGGNV